VFPLEPPRVGEPSNQRWCQSVGVVYKPAVVGDAVGPRCLLDGGDAYVAVYYRIRHVPRCASDDSEYFSLKSFKNINVGV